MTDYGTYTTYIGDGSTVSFAITFSYTEEAQVKALINFVETSDFSIVGSDVVFNTAPADGAKVTIARESGLPSVTFTKYTLNDADTLNTAFTGNKNALEEVTDRVSTATQSALSAETFAAEAEVAKNLAEGYKDDTNVIKSETQAIKDATETLKNETQVARDQTVAIKDELVGADVTIDGGGALDEPIEVTVDGGGANG